MKKTENILFYAAAGVQPPKEDLEKILDALPVTNIKTGRYTYVMAPRFFLPIGLLALILIMLFGLNGKKEQTVLELPATLTKQNVNDSLNKVDESVSTSIDETDGELKNLGEENTDTEDENENE